MVNLSRVRAGSWGDMAGPIPGSRVFCSTQSAPIGLANPFTIRTRHAASAHHGSSHRQKADRPSVVPHFARDFSRLSEISHSRHRSVADPGYEGILLSWTGSCDSSGLEWSAGSRHVPEVLWRMNASYAEFRIMPSRLPVLSATLGLEGLHLIAIAHGARIPEFRQDRARYQPAVLPLHINFETAAGAKTLEIPFGPGRRKGRQKVHFVGMTLKQHFRKAGGSAKVAVDLEHLDRIKVRHMTMARIDCLRRRRAGDAARPPRRACPESRKQGQETLN